MDRLFMQHLRGLIIIRSRRARPSPDCISYVSFSYLRSIEPQYFQKQNFLVLQKLPD